jgi:hypothetical protein
MTRPRDNQASDEGADLIPFCGVEIVFIPKAEARRFRLFST